jgi:hypothetical protein
VTATAVKELKMSGGRPARGVARSGEKCREKARLSTPTVEKGPEFA